MSDSNEFGARIEKATCEIHGEFDQKIVTILGRDMRGMCPVCREEKETAEAARAADEKAMLERMRLAEKLRGALIPKRFTQKDFESYQADDPKRQKALEKCRAYADNFGEMMRAGRCLLLLGKPGTGKTHLAVAIANQIMRTSNYQCVYRTVPSILQYIKGSYDQYAEYNETHAYDSLTKPALLVIDEIGATKQSEFELSVLFSIINARYENQLPTIIVSNLMPNELPAAIGERCVDRLREGGGIALVFDWESMRSKIDE